MNNEIGDLTDKLLAKIANKNICQKYGKIISIKGVSIEGVGLNLSIGEIVNVINDEKMIKFLAEVVSINNDSFILVPFGSVDRLCLNCKILSSSSGFNIPLSIALNGRVLDAMGNPIDNKLLPNDIEYISKSFENINPLHRIPITQILKTGIKSIDLFTPIGIGQRIGIFAGSGVGKSTLMNMICRNAKVDLIIVAMIGERGREVNDFINNVLGKQGLNKSIIYVATAEQPAVFRRLIAYTATQAADWFRNKGYNVLLIMDSITRFAFAQREIGIAASEPMGARGYPASIFSLLPPLVERGGALVGKGSITSIYTVLVEGDDHNEPIADHMRSILDGHIVLDRLLADKGHFPSINVLKSISRLTNILLNSEQKNLTSKLKNYLALYEEFSDMIQLGVYNSGQNKLLDNIIKCKIKIDSLLTQHDTETVHYDNMWITAKSIVSEIESGVNK